MCLKLAYERLKDTLSHTAKSIFNSEDYYFYAANFESEIPLTAKIEAEYGVATLDDIDELVRIQPTISNYRKLMVEWLDRGNYCFVARSNGKIVSSTWYAAERWSINNSPKFKVPEKTVYSHDAFTVPEYRGFGVSGAIINVVKPYLMKKGFVGFFALKRTDNVSSIRISEKRSFKPLGIVSTKRFFFYTFCKLSSDSDEDLAKMRSYFLK